MNMSIYELYKRGFISESAAMSASDNKNELSQMIRGVYSSINNATVAKAMQLNNELKKG